MSTMNRLRFCCTSLDPMSQADGSGITSNIAGCCVERMRTLDDLTLAIKSFSLELTRYSFHDSVTRMLHGLSKPQEGQEM